MIRYISAEDILLMHALVVDETGGTHGVRDVNLLASVAESPKTTFDGKELYPSLFTKAAVLCEKLVNYHVFVDGNKRTAFVSLGRFLEINGMALEASNAEVELVMVSIAEKKMGISEIVDWIQSHSQKI
jgi:death-on-curing protein